MLSFRKIALGMSGGVDSSVAALLLKEKGFNVVGVFMRNWDLADENGMCSMDEEFKDATYACDRLKIPLYEVNFVKEYWNDVFTTFLKDCESGLRPNPDVLCNKFIKFKAFYNHAIDNLKADAIAMGHYAKSSFGNYLENYEPGTNAKLLIPSDRWKDQTLFLSQIPQEALRRTMFPLGNLNKDVVKRIAMENGLEKLAKKRESTGMCFIGKRNFSKFMAEYVTPKPGRFINMLTGEVKGTHEGEHLWTIGQRTRLTPECSYVARKEKNSPDVQVVKEGNHPSLFSRFFFTEAPYWIAESPDLSGINEFAFRFQHSRPLTMCQAYQLKCGELFVKLPKPLRAICPGQFAVFYRGDECLGSAKIIDVGPTEFSLGNPIPEDYEEYELQEACALGR